MKKAISVILVLVLTLSCFICIANANSAQPMLLNVSKHTEDLTISGVNSTSSAYVEACSSMKLGIRMDLQKLKSGSYSTVETWTASKTGTSLSMSKTRLINMLSTYRLKVTYTAGSETIVAYAYP